MPPRPPLAFTLLSTFYLHLTDAAETFRCNDSETFNAGFGGCATYRAKQKGIPSNHPWCDRDKDTDNTLAKDACPYACLNFSKCKNGQGESLGSKKPSMIFDCLFKKITPPPGQTCNNIGQKPDVATSKPICTATSQYYQPIPAICRHDKNNACSQMIIYTRHCAEACKAGKGIWGKRAMRFAPHQRTAYCGARCLLMRCEEYCTCLLPKGYILAATSPPPYVTAAADKEKYGKQSSNDMWSRRENNLPTTTYYCESGIPGLAGARCGGSPSNEGLSATFGDKDYGAGYSHDLQATDRLQTIFANVPGVELRQGGAPASSPTAASPSTGHPTPVKTEANPPPTTATANPTSTPTRTTANPTPRTTTENPATRRPTAAVTTARPSADPLSGWRCNRSYYNKRDGCDCNCGILDPDCAISGQTLYNCDSVPAAYCDSSGTCRSRTARPTAPIPTARPSEVQPTARPSTALPTPEPTDRPSKNPTPTPTTPRPTADPLKGWKCNRQYYNKRDGCDCNCGIHDPDCGVAGQKLYNCDGPRAYCDASGKCRSRTPEPTTARPTPAVTPKPSETPTTAEPTAEPTSPPSPPPSSWHPVASMPARPRL